jgi:hypothetical protein
MLISALEVIPKIAKVLLYSGFQPYEGQSNRLQIPRFNWLDNLAKLRVSNVTENRCIEVLSILLKPGAT